MVLKQFPDISMVRQLRNDAVRPANSWKNVALNFRCKEACRTGVESPYSLFLNKKGFSHCTVNKQAYRIETDKFLLTQPGEIYGLTVDNTDTTELCNIHINRDFFNGWAHALTASHEQQLDNPDTCISTTPKIFTQLYPVDQKLERLTGQLCSIGSQDIARFELILGDIVRHLLLSNEEVRQKISRLPFVKAAVRADVYRRLALAADYIYSNYTATLNLDAICKEIGMSQFHFLRTFKALYGITPYQYLTEVRMMKAQRLLSGTDQPVSSISFGLGFEYPNSFIKAFQKTYSISPLRYRKAVNSNFG